MIRKGDMKQAPWIKAYEDGTWTPACSAACRPRPDRQGHVGDPRSHGDKLSLKLGHPQRAPTTAWVPSPTAATLHATHYHKVNVKAVQRS